MLAVASLLSLGAAGITRAALPVAYGGVIRWPASTALRVPDPNAPRTLFEASLARSVFDGLYDVDDDLRPIPVLAESLPMRDGERYTIRLREGLTFHDRRPVTAERVLESLTASTSFWLAGLRRPDGSLDITVVDERTLSVGASRGTRPSRVLAATALSVRQGNVGTGAFRARMRSGVLELRGMRRAARGAPYLDRVLLFAPRERAEALREFELRRVNGSWFGARLYAGSDRAAASSSASRAPLMIVETRAGSALATLTRHLDRRRLARVGLTPSDRLAPRLPPPRVAARAASSTITMAIDQGDPLMQHLVDAIRAQLDEHGVQRRVGPRARADVALVSVVPGLPGDAAMLATAFDLAGDRDAAEDLARRNLANTRHAVERAPSLRAVVLGRRTETLHHRRARGVRRGTRGGLLLREIFVSRNNGGEARE